MTGLNWKRAKTYNSGTSNLFDENRLGDRDAAAHWLRKAEEKKTRQRSKEKPKKPMRREDLRTGPIDGRPGLVIFTDGACEPNPGKGGWAFVVYRDGAEVYYDCGGDIKSTNNIMEMTGVLRALEWLLASPDRQFAKVCSDSQYVVKGCNEWRFGWKSRGWRRVVNNRTREMEPIKNADLWKDLDAALATAPAKVEWVKGHAGILGNERADELSQEGRRKAMSGVNHRPTADNDEAAIDPMILEKQLRYTVD